MKQCRKCKSDKDLKEFTKDAEVKDGLSRHCRSCQKEYRNVLESRGKIKRGTSLYKNLSSETRERERVRKKKYKQEHPEVVAAINRRTNAKRKGISIEATEKETREFMETATRCLQCGAADDLTLDHIIPVSWGFLSFHGLNNFQILCNQCNSSKNNYGSIDFRSESVCSGNMLQFQYA